MFEAYANGLFQVRAAIREGRWGDAQSVLAGMDAILPEQYVVYY